MYMKLKLVFSTSNTIYMKTKHITFNSFLLYLLDNLWEWSKLCFTIVYVLYTLCTFSIIGSVTWSPYWL